MASAAKFVDLVTSRSGKDRRNDDQRADWLFVGMINVLHAAAGGSRAVLATHAGKWCVGIIDDFTAVDAIHRFVVRQGRDLIVADTA